MSNINDPNILHEPSIVPFDVSTLELSYIDGLTSNAQDQINALSGGSSTDGVARTAIAQHGQYCNSSGTSSALTATPTTPITLTAGARISVKLSTAIAAGATLNVSDTGALPIYKAVGAGGPAAIVAGEASTGMVVDFVYNTAYVVWQVMSPTVDVAITQHLQYGLTGGTANAYTLVAPNFALTDGASVTCVFHATSIAGNCSINVNGTGAVGIQYITSTGLQGEGAWVGGEVIAGMVGTLVYRSSANTFQLTTSRKIKDGDLPSASNAAAQVAQDTLIAAAGTAIAQQCQFAIAGGTINARTVAATGWARTDGATITFQVPGSGTNTASTTLNVNGTGAAVIYKVQQGAGGLYALEGGELMQGSIQTCVWSVNASGYCLTSAHKLTASEIPSTLGATTFSGNLIIPANGSIGQVGAGSYSTFCGGIGASQAQGAYVSVTGVSLAGGSMGLYTGSGAGAKITALDKNSAEQLRVDENGITTLGKLNYITGGGTANAYTATPAIAWTSYVDGAELSILIPTVNTTASTLAVSGLAAKNIYKLSQGGTVALAGGELLGSIAATFRYSSAVTAFILVSSYPQKATDIPSTLGATSFAGAVDMGTSKFSTRLLEIATGSQPTPDTNAYQGFLSTYSWMRNAPGANGNHVFQVNAATRFSIQPATNATYSVLSYGAIAGYPNLRLLPADTAARIAELGSGTLAKLRLHQDTHSVYPGGYQEFSALLARAASTAIALCPVATGDRAKVDLMDDAAGTADATVKVDVSGGVTFVPLSDAKYVNSSSPGAAEIGVYISAGVLYCKPGSGLTVKVASFSKIGKA